MTWMTVPKEEKLQAILSNKLLSVDCVVLYCMCVCVCVNAWSWRYIVSLGGFVCESLASSALL